MNASERCRLKNRGPYRCCACRNIQIHNKPEERQAIDQETTKERTTQQQGYTVQYRSKCSVCCSGSVSCSTDHHKPGSAGKHADMHAPYAARSSMHAIMQTTLQDSMPACMHPVLHVHMQPCRQCSAAYSRACNVYCEHL